MKLIFASSVIVLFSTSIAHAVMVDCTVQLIQACTAKGCETLAGAQTYNFDFGSGKIVSCTLEDGTPKCVGYVGKFSDVTDRGTFGTMELDGLIFALIRYDPKEHKFTVTNPRTTEVRTAFGNCAQERP